MDGLHQRTVVVGISGSRSSAGTLRWAADEARRRRATLLVVRGWDPEFSAHYGPAADRQTPGEQRAAASEDLITLIRAVFGSASPDGVAAELARGIPERILVDRSWDADLLVLGSAAPPTPTARSIGPVIRACLSRAHCPVAVVGATRPADPRASEGAREHAALLRAASSAQDTDRSPYGLTDQVLVGR